MLPSFTNSYDPLFFTQSPISHHPPALGEHGSTQNTFQSRRKGLVETSGGFQPLHRYTGNAVVNENAPFKGDHLTLGVF